MLAGNQDNVFKRDCISTPRTVAVGYHYNNPIKRAGLVQYGYHCHLIEIQLYLAM